ncbi:hypothetical protein [Planktotalea sp.]|uniref:hypothetical protein n=1 Tax=Planktotalea sp. TaxID=2029877 RepID=UPI0035C7BD13
MRKFLGIVVLAVGVGGLGYWGAKDHALDMQNAISERATAAVAGAVHGVETSVEGRDIRVTGLADSEAEREALLSALNAVEGRRVVLDEIDVLPSADPYTIAATRKDRQTLLQGNVPSEAMRSVLMDTGAAGVEGLTLASGAPERWEAAIGAGLSALTQMDEGSVSLTGKALRLTGLVDQPSDRDALIGSIALPDGYTLQNDIETRDDGAPIAYTVNYDASEGVNVDGKLPNGLDLAQIGEALGVSNISGDVTNAMDGNPSALLAALGRLKDWLPEFDSASVNVSENGTSVAGVTTPGVNVSLVTDALATDFVDTATLDFKAANNSVQRGAERINAATGITEQFQFGSWLPKAEFRPSLANCATEADKLLATTKINFLSGSTDLGPRSQRAINALASIMARCVGAGLAVELGGHTDNTGSGNYE